MSESALDSQDVFAKLTEIIVKCTGFNAEEITRESRINDELAVDSLSLVEIAIRTEDTFGVRIDDEQAQKFGTVGDLVDFIVASSVDNR